MKIAITVFVALLTLTAHAQTPLQAQSQIYSNQFASGAITNAVVEGTTNVVPVQPWTIQVIEVITILRSQRSELRAMLTNTPLLSVSPITNVPTTGPVTDNVGFIGPAEPPKTPKRKPSP